MSKHTPRRNGPFDYSGGGTISVSVASIVNSPKVQKQVRAVKELRREMNTDLRADHKAARETATIASAQCSPGEFGNLAICYRELWELAKAVLKVADRDTDIFNALRKALEE